MNEHRHNHTAAHVLTAMVIAALFGYVMWLNYQAANL